MRHHFILLVSCLACILVAGLDGAPIDDDPVEGLDDVDRTGEETMSSLIDRVEGFLVALKEARESTELDSENESEVMMGAMANLKETLEAVDLLKESAVELRTEIETEKANLVKVREEVETSLGDKTKELEGKNRELEELRKEVEESRKEVEESKAKIQEVVREKEAAVEESQKEKERADQEVEKEAKLQEQLNKQKASFNEIETNAKIVAKGFQKKKDEVAGLEHRLATMKENYNVTAQKLEAMTLKERETEDDLHRLEGDFEVLSQKHVDDIAQLNDPKLLDYLTKTAISHEHPELAIALNKTLQRMAPAGEVLLSGVAAIGQANEVIGDSLSGYLEQQQASTVGVVITYGLFTVPVAISFRIISKIHMANRYHFGLLLNFYCAAFFFILFIMSFVAVNQDALQALRIWNDPLFDLLQLLFFFVFVSQMTINVFSLSVVYSGRVSLVAQVGIYFQMMLSAWFGFQYYDAVWKRAMLEMQPVMGRWMYLLGCMIFSSGIFVSMKYMIPKKSHNSASIFSPNNAEKEV